MTPRQRESTVDIFPFCGLLLAFHLLLTVCMLNGITNSLERYMDLVSLRQKLVASNIANADTPGYKTLDIDFQAEFKTALEGGEPHPAAVAGLQTKNDGNNVDLDREARMLAENALRFNVASSLMRSQIRLVKDAIQEGKTS